MGKKLKAFIVIVYIITAIGIYTQYGIKEITLFILTTIVIVAIYVIYKIIKRWSNEEYESDGGYLSGVFTD